MDWFFQINPPSSRSSSNSPTSHDTQKQPESHSVQTIRCSKVHRLHGSLEGNLISHEQHASTHAKGHAVPPNTQIAKALRSLSEALVWSDSVKRTDLFEYFFESRTHELLLKLPLTPTSDLSTPLLRFFNVIFENIEQPSILFFLFSNNYINNVILLSYNLDNEEALSYYVTLLKNLSVKLNSRTVELLFNEHLDDFPLFSEAVKWYRHEERMIRIAARTITLNVFKVNNTHASDFLIKKRGFFTAVANLLTEEVDVLIRFLSADGGEFYNATSQLDEIVDHLLYIQDIFALGFPSLSRSLAETMMRAFIVPVLIDNLTKSPMKRHVSLFLLAQIVQSITYAPLVNLVVEKIFGVEDGDEDTDLGMSGPTMSKPVETRMGAVRAGSGGLFDDDVFGGMAPVSPTRRGTVKKGGEPAPKKLNSIRPIVIGLISPESTSHRKPLDQDLDITLSLSLLISVLRSTSVQPEVLQKANLFPRRSKKSRILMDSLMSDQGPETSTESISYDLGLVMNLIKILRATSVADWRAVTAELAARCLIDIAATGGTRSEGLVENQMDELKAAYQLWCGVLLDFLTQKNDLVPDLLDYESIQTAPDIDRLVRDTKLFIPSESLTSHALSTPASPTSSFPLTDARAIDLAVRMFLLTSECLKAFGVKWEVPMPVHPMRSVGPTGQLISLSARSMTPCVIQLDVKMAPVNGYFVFDDERIILVEPDRLMLGKGRVRESRSILEVRASKLTDNFTMELESAPLVFASDSSRRSLSLAPPFIADQEPSLPLLGSVLPVQSASYEVVTLGEFWKIRLVFTGGMKARDQVMEHVRMKRELGRERRRGVIGEWLTGAIKV
ncbi:hypothetical protein BC829DRAFT_414104 [Chytridium lagenaria]|nr:hypothetical protein BC829DRAFT_414104 [Chytridium lagenaria]